PRYSVVLGNAIYNEHTKHCKTTQNNESFALSIKVASVVINSENDKPLFQKRISLKLLFRGDRLSDEAKSDFGAPQRS
ncbi:MAG: hypothetical protein ACK56F_15470, partial [bacterium]